MYWISSGVNKLFSVSPKKGLPSTSAPLTISQHTQLRVSPQTPNHGLNTTLPRPVRRGRDGPHHRQHDIDQKAADEVPHDAADARDGVYARYPDVVVPRGKRDW